MKLEADEKAFLALLNVGAVVVILAVVAAIAGSLEILALALLMETCLVTYVIRNTMQTGMMLKEMQDMKRKAEDDLK